MTPQELRNSIVLHAIQGKLVAQYSEEGTGEELFQQIQAEKQALIKAKQVKKENPLPKISEDDILFDIPETWRWCYVGDLFNHNTGKAMNSSAKKSDKPGSVQKFITTSNLYWDSFDFTNVKEMFFTDDEISRCSATKNDILICEGGAYYGRTAIWTYDYDICFQNHVHRLRAYKPLVEKYFYYIFRFYRETGKMQAKGTAMPGLSSIALHTLIIPLPPYAEQKRIVAKLEEILPLIDRYEAAWNKLEEFNKRFPEDMQKSILQMAIQGKLVEQHPEEGTGEELFQQIQAEKQALIKAGAIKKEKPLPKIAEDEIPFDIPDTWKWVKLGDVLREVIVPMRDKPPFSKEGTPWCRIEDRDGFLLNGSKSNQLVSDETIQKMNLKVLPIGTVLSACTGGSIGTIVINTIECCTNQTFNGLVCSSGLYNWYLFWYLKTQFSALRKVGTGTTIAYVSQNKSREMLLPLPPLDEQKRIVAKLEEILPLCERLK